MSELMVLEGDVPAIFAGDNVAEVNRKLTENLGGSFAVLSLRGKAWRVKFAGDETTLKNSETGEALQTIPVVLLDVSDTLTKTYYKSKYVEGSDQKPDCFSTNAERPDAAVENPVHSQCATCPMNQFGSAESETGSKGKACQDNMRLAVVPANDVENEAYGGPMLLRLPPASFKNLRRYTNWLTGQGRPFYSVRTFLQFNPDADYAEVLFKPERTLTNEEALSVKQMKDHPGIKDVLSVGFDSTLEPAATSNPEPQQTVAAEPKPAAAAPDVEVTPSTPETEIAETSEDLDDMLSSVMAS